MFEVCVCVCVCLSSPIESLIRSAPQNGKQMEMAVGEENTANVSDCVPMVTVKRLQQFGLYDHSSLFTGTQKVQTGFEHSYQTGKYFTICIYNYIS